MAMLIFPVVLRHVRDGVYLTDAGLEANQVQDAAVCWSGGEVDAVLRHVERVGAWVTRSVRVVYSTQEAEGELFGSRT